MFALSPNELTLRPIAKRDNAGVAKLIRAVMPEFGASGPGFAILDPEVDRMFETYALPKSAYFVLTDGNGILGGAGVAPLLGGDADTCELRKMYFLKEARGHGWGRQVLARALETARTLGFAKCYLETLKNMDVANALYRKFGFEKIAGPLGNTGHFGCDAWYVKNL